MIKVKTKHPEVLKEAMIKKAVKVALERGTEKYLRMIHEYIDSGKSFTPRTGHLQRNIGYREKGNFVYEIYANAEYAPFVEFGTRPHVIKPKNKSVFSWVKGYTRFFAKEVNHPGSRPYPFFYAEIEKRKEEVKREMVQAFMEEING